MRSLREPKALTIQPMRCRSDQNMVEILSKRPQQNSLQVVHFTSARRFDDGQDGIRVLSRTLKRMAQQCQAGAVEVVNHGRAVKHRLLEISRAAKSLTQASRERMQESYQKLLGLTRSAVRQAGLALRRCESGRLPVVGSVLRMEVQAGQLRHFLPLVEKVITQ